MEDEEYRELQAEWVKKEGVQEGDTVFIYRGLTDEDPWTAYNRGVNPSTVGLLCKVEEIYKNSLDLRSLEKGEYIRIPFFPVKRVTPKNRVKLERESRKIRNAFLYNKSQEEWAEINRISKGSIVYAKGEKSFIDPNIPPSLDYIAPLKKAIKTVVGEEGVVVAPVESGKGVQVFFLSINKSIDMPFFMLESLKERAWKEFWNEHRTPEKNDDFILADMRNVHSFFDCLKKSVEERLMPDSHALDKDAFNDNLSSAQRIVDHIYGEILLGKASGRIIVQDEDFEKGFYPKLMQDICWNRGGVTNE